MNKFKCESSNIKDDKGNIIPNLFLLEIINDGKDAIVAFPLDYHYGIKIIPLHTITIYRSSLVN